MTLKREDPTVNNLRSGFGKQVVSKATTNPAFSLGSAERDAYLRVREIVHYGC